MRSLRVSERARQHASEYHALMTGVANSDDHRSLVLGLEYPVMMESLDMEACAHVLGLLQPHSDLRATVARISR